jgi:hypothetical protein
MEAWAEIVAQAMSHGGKTKEESLEALKSFQSSVLNNFQEKVSSIVGLLKASPSHMA